MPYINQVKRAEIDPYVEMLAPHLANAGEVNYSITKLLILFGAASDSYNSLNEAIGILECVKQEFYRRAVTFYEDKKKEENGDVYLWEED